jgi:hypothetical protein
MRQSYIDSLPEDVACLRFAPRVLKVVASPPAAASAAEALHALRQYVIASPSDHPLLLRTLFSGQGDEHADALASLSASLDLSPHKRLQHLPDLQRGILHVAALCIKDDGAHVNLDGPVGDLMESSMEPAEATALDRAWEACRYGQRFECQAVEDLGALKVLRVRDLMAQEGVESEGASLALVLLANLVDTHNHQVELLEGPGLHSTVAEIPLHQAQTQIVAQHLVPWGKAREWLESNILSLLQQAPMSGSCAKMLESLVRAWLTQMGSLQLVKFSLEGWPRIRQVPACIVRLPAHEQTPALPHELVEAIDEYFLQYGLLRDKALLALEALKKIAMAVNAAGGRISPEAPLHEKVLALLPPAACSANGERTLVGGHAEPPPDLLYVLGKAGKGGLRVKHLNALQDCLSERIDSRVEQALPPAYRTPIDDVKFWRDIEALDKEQLSSLIRKLSTLAEMLARQQHFPSHHGVFPHPHITGSARPASPSLQHEAFHLWLLLLRNDLHAKRGPDFFA